MPKPEFDITNDRLVAMGEVSKALGVSRSTFERMIKDGVFPDAHFYIFGMKRWSLNRVNVWVAEQAKAPKKF